MQAWFRPGRFWASGDVPPFVRSGIEPEFGWLWNHGITGMGSPSYTIARAVEVWLIRFVSALGGSETLAQRIFYTLLAVFAAAAVAWCVAALTRSRTAVIASGLVVLFNPFWLTRLPNPLVLLIVGCLGVFTGVLVRVAQGRKRRVTSFALATIVSSFLALNPPLLAVLATWSACVVLAGSLVGGHGGTKRAASFAAKAVPLVLLVNGWWLAPLLLTLSDPVGFEITATTSPIAWAWTQVNNSFGNIVRLIAHWAWMRPEYVPAAEHYTGGVPAWGLWLLPLLVLIGPFFASRDRRRLAWSLLGTIAVLAFISKGLHAPFTNANEHFYKIVPGSQLLRDPFSKLGPLLVVLYALMIGMLVDGLLARRSWQRARVAGHATVAAGAVALMAITFPMWTGSVVATTRPIFPSAHVELPDWWRAAADAIDQDQTPGKLLTLPLNDYYQLPTSWGYYGVDHTSFLVRRSVVQQLPGGYFGDLPAAAALMKHTEQAILNNDGAAVPRLLSALGVSHVLVRGDLDLDMVGGRQLASPDRFDGPLRRLPGVHHMRNFGPLSLYRLEKTPDSVTASRRVVIAPHDPPSAATVTASVPPHVAVVTTLEDRDAIASLPAHRASVSTRPRSGDRDLIAEGTKVVVIRQQGPQIAHGAVEGDSFVLREGWTVGSGPEPTAAPDEIVRIDLNGRRPRAIVVNDAVVPLAADGAFVQLASGPVDITLLGDDPSTISLSGPSALGDCNSKDDDLIAEKLGLSAVSLSPGTQLSARAHQACVSWTLGAVRPGSWLHFHIDHRSLQGRPARLCLFDMQSRRCIPIVAPTSDASWTHYDSVVRVSENPGPLRVYAYADGPENTHGSSPRTATVTEYRRLEVAALEPITGVTMDIESLTPRETRIEGPTTWVVRGPANRNLLGRFGPLGDCHRYSSRSAAEAGLGARALADGIELTASRHSACVFAPIEHIDSSSILKLSFRYRSLRGSRQVRVCVHDPGKRRCLPLEPTDGSPVTHGSLPTSQDARTFRAWVRVPENTHALRLYLYADGAPRGTEGVETTLRYEQLTVRPVAPFSLVVIDPSVLGGKDESPPVRVEWAGPASYSATVLTEGRPLILASHESAAPGWQLRSSDVRASQVTVQGYRSGWALTPESDTSARVDVRYAPAMRVRWLIPIALVAAALMALHAIGDSLLRRLRK